MDYEDLIAGPRTLTVKGVSRGPSAEQPLNISFEEFDRPWRPSKGMRRVLAMAWGVDGVKYAGRKVTLFGDPTVKWAGQEVGGIRIRALSHIDEPLKVALTVTRGKREPYTVQPIKDTTDPAKLAAALADITNAGSIEALKTAWALAETRGVQTHPDVIAAKEKRKAELA
jgi:hypothetical protein